MKAIFIAVCVFASVALCDQTFGQTQPPSAGPVAARVNLHLKSVQGSDHLWYLSLHTVGTTDVKPTHVRETPPDAPTRPVYFTVRVGDDELTGTTYRSTVRPQDVKLYLDTDGDGLWSDEKMYLGLWQRMFALSVTYFFGPVSTSLPGQRGQGGAFYAQCAGGERVTFYPAFYRNGKVTLKAKTYKIAVVDSDFDGRFDRTFVPPASGSRYPGCDVLVIAPEYKEKFTFTTETEASDFLPLSRLVQVEGTYYEIDVAPDGSTIEFREPRIEYGTLDLGGADVKMTLYSDAARQCLRGASDTWRLPAGRYSAVELELGQEDVQGRQWQFKQGRGGSGRLSDFEIRPGQATSFDMGPSFQIRTSMGRGSRGDVWVDFEIEGLAGESYQPGGMRDGTMAPEPGFTILDNAGQIVHSGRFKYG